MRLVLRQATDRAGTLRDSGSEMKQAELDSHPSVLGSDKKQAVLQRQSGREGWQTRVDGADGGEPRVAQGKEDRAERSVGGVASYIGGDTRVNSYDQGQGAKVKHLWKDQHGHPARHRVKRANREKRWSIGAVATVSPLATHAPRQNDSQHLPQPSDWIRPPDLTNRVDTVFVHESRLSASDRSPYSRIGLRWTSETSYKTHQPGMLVVRYLRTCPISSSLRAIG